MPQDISHRAIQKVVAPQQFLPPTAREIRAHAAHRLQVGLFGLCAMLLLVGLANIIMERAREVEDDHPPVELIVPPKQPKTVTDPLADIGVVPAATPSVAATSGPAQ